MGEQDRVAVIGAGIIGCAIAFGLAREGWRVRLDSGKELTLVREGRFWYADDEPR